MLFAATAIITSNNPRGPPQMIETLTLLLAMQLLGEVLVRLLELPVPGPVVGMAVLFFALLIRGKPLPGAMGQTVNGLLRHLSMLFIPAGVGVILYLGVIADQWLAISLSLVFSTLLTIAVTGWLMKKLGSESGGQADGQDQEHGHG